MADLVCFATQRAILTLESNSRWASDNEYDDLLFPLSLGSPVPDPDPHPNQARRTCIKLGEKTRLKILLFAAQISVSLCPRLRFCFLFSSCVRAYAEYITVRVRWQCNSNRIPSINTPKLNPRQPKSGINPNRPATYPINTNTNTNTNININIPRPPQHTLCPQKTVHCPPPPPLPSATHRPTTPRTSSTPFSFTSYLVHPSM